MNQVIEKYQWTPGMGEISGFGGGYEDACRKMLRSGMNWLDEHPEADPHFHGYEGIYGILTEDNNDAKQLSFAITSVEPGCSGAMHQAVASHCLYIRRNGWEKYCEEMSRPDEAEK